MKTYLDREGLTYVTDAVDYADALNLTYDEVVGNRRSLLSQLRHGAGVTILTGPMGAPYWSVVGPEVQVRIVPDGEVYDVRVSDIEWPFVAAGATRAEARRLAARSSAPRPTKHMRPLSLWNMAQLLGDAPAATTPIIITDWDIETWTVDEALAYLDGVQRDSGRNTTIALDWEWSIDDDTYLAPIGLAVADATTTAWVPVWTPEGRDVAGGEKLQRSVATFLQGGGAAIWHDARADLGTQYPGDPLELVPNYQGHDTKIMMFLNGDVQLSLKHGARKYLHREPVEFGAFSASLEHIDPDAVARYAGADGRNTFDLWMRLTAALGRKEQLDVYENFERRLPPFIASMERYGTPLDVDRARERLAETWTDAAYIREAVVEATGWDLYSDADTRGLLTEQLGFDPGTLDQRVLSRFDSGWVDVVLQFRRARTLGRNFLGSHLARRDALGARPDYRVYPRFNQAGPIDQEDRSAPRTGRLSSANPNLQNQPRSLRDIFVPPAGYTWWSFDYSQLELRVAAALSDDPAMVEAYTSDPPLDLHNELQAEVLERSGMAVVRPAAKQANFAKKYGSDWKMIRDILATQRIPLSVVEAKAISDAHDTRFPDYVAWAELAGSGSATRGYAETLWGRRCYKTFDHNDLGSIAGFRRFAVNASIQGTAALIVKKCMLDLAPVLLKYGAHCCNQTHDELNGWVEKEKVDAFLVEARRVATGIGLPAGVPLDVECGSGASWGDAH